MITEMHIGGDLNETERRLIAQWIKAKFSPCVVIAWSVEE